VYRGNEARRLTTTLLNQEHGMATKKTITARTTRPPSTKKTTAKKAAPPRNPGFDILTMVADVDEDNKQQVDDLLAIGREVREAPAQAARFLELLNSDPIDTGSSEFIAALRQVKLNAFAVIALRKDAHNNGLSEFEERETHRRTGNARDAAKARHEQHTGAMKERVRSHWLDWQVEPARHASNEEFAEAMTALEPKAKHDTVLTWCTEWRKQFPLRR
jgi:hypothetical protein